MSGNGFDGSSANLATKNKYELNLSNFPNLSTIPDNELDLTVFSSKVKSVNLPNKTIQQLYSFYNHERQQHPSSQGHRDTNTLTVHWILDSRFMNYFLFNCWYYGTKLGIPARGDLLRDNCIDRLDVYTLDNTAKMPTAMMSFYRVYLTGIGNLDLEFGSADTLYFDTTFEYEQSGISIQRKKPDGSYVLEPLRIISTAGIRV